MPHSLWGVTLLPSPLRRDVVPFAARLGEHGTQLAVVTADERLDHADLASRVADAARHLGSGRRLVAIEAGNDLATLVAHLAVLSTGHVGLLLDGDRPGDVERLVAHYDPDVVVRRGDVPARWTHRHADPAHDLHPDLALLLSTSGSTGAAKLVRLSHENLQSNATAIAEYLGITAGDRAITSLPIHYCYGLSVVHSHLAAGAAVVLTDLSVVDPCFWDLARASGTTALAGVPYTFELLDRVGPERLAALPLRVVTQAGGRLHPDHVRRLAALGRRQGWDLVVMYGQTEATARIAYLPPELAATHPDAIGIPIPGGRIEIERVAEVDDPDVGELVYHGPNVMLGYAESPADLALGPTTDALRTGDLGRVDADGIHRVVGRRSRFLKLFGLRVDLAELERRLADEGITATCTGDDEALVVGVDADERTGRPHDPATSTAVQDAVRGLVGLPATAVRVVVGPIPRLANGKPDLVALGRAASEPADRGTDPAATGPEDDPVGRVIAEVLGIDDAPTDATFVDLGGDSLSYVEMSIRLESAIGHLPADWHLLPVGDLRRLAHAPGPRRSVWRRHISTVETGVALRAVAIVTIVATHAGLIELRGGAHVLLAVAGFNFARFQVASSERWRSVARIAVPAMIWVAGLLLLTDDGSALGLVFLNVVAGDVAVNSHWHLWFVEVLVLFLVALALALSLPPVRRLERRWPRALPFALFGLALLPVLDTEAAREVTRNLARPHLVAWLFLLGWAAARADRWWLRLALCAGAALVVPGFFGDPVRDAVVLGGIVALVWASVVPLPRALVRTVGALASTSLYTYLTHWQVYPWLTEQIGVPGAVVGSLAVGVLAGTVAARLIARFEPKSGLNLRCAP